MLASATYCNTLQCTATHCNTLQHTATHCNKLYHGKQRVAEDARIDMHHRLVPLEILKKSAFQSVYRTSRHKLTFEKSCLFFANFEKDARVDVHHRLVALEILKTSAYQSVYGTFWFVLTFENSWLFCECLERCSRRWIWSPRSALQHAATRCNTLQRAASNSQLDKFWNSQYYSHCIWCTQTRADFWEFLVVSSPVYSHFTNIKFYTLRYSQKSAYPVI